MKYILLQDEDISKLSIAINLFRMGEYKLTGEALTSASSSLSWLFDLHKRLKSAEDFPKPEKEEDLPKPSKKKSIG